MPSKVIPPPIPIMADRVAVKNAAIIRIMDSITF
jgi:hypothetical protein